MLLTKFEQSGFILETQSGFRIAFDIGNKTPLSRLVNVKPVDIFIVSHIHGDHFFPENIKQLQPKKIFLNHECLEVLEDQTLMRNVTEVKSGDKIFVNEMAIEFFTVDHGPNISAPVENLGFLFEIDKQKIYFAGDMFYPSGIDVSSLDVEYALLPVGTHYTFGPREALNFAKGFKSINQIICMHYEKTPETRQQFLDLAKGTFEAE